MQPHSLLDQILPILSAVRNDKEKLARILTFLESEILPEIEEEDNEIKIPGKYEALVHTIADSTSAGLICHLNMDPWKWKIIRQTWIRKNGKLLPEKYSWQNTWNGRIH